MLVKSVASHLIAGCALFSIAAWAEPESKGTTETVSFDKGSDALNAVEQAELKALVGKLESQSRQQKVYVAAWADQELPPDGREALGNDSVKLARSRADKVADALRKSGLKGDYVEVNLAKNPNTLQEIFRTRPAKLGNKALHDVSTREAALDDAGSVLKSNGGPSKVVIYIQQ